MFDDAVRGKFMLSKREIERKRVAPVQELGLGKLYGVFVLFVCACRGKWSISTLFNLLGKQVSTIRTMRGQIWGRIRMSSIVMYVQRGKKFLIRRAVFRFVQ